MARKKKVEELKADEKPQGKFFEYGDLAVVCSCGRVQIITRGIQKGIQLILATNEDSRVQLKCDECNADITLRLLEGVKPEEPETTEEPEKTEDKEVPVDESVQEESKQEPSL